MTHLADSRIAVSHVYIVECSCGYENEFNGDLFTKEYVILDANKHLKVCAYAGSRNRRQ